MMGRLSLISGFICRELIAVECEDAGTKFKMKGYVSNVNFSTKKLMFTMFINNRLVDSSGMWEWEAFLFGWIIIYWIVFCEL